MPSSGSSEAAGCLAFSSREKAVELDPFSPIAIWTLAATYAFERRYDEAIAAQGRLLAANPGFVFMDDVAGVGWRGKGDFERSVEAYERAQKYWHQPMAGLGVTYARMGRIHEAKAIARELEALRAKKEHVIPDFTAMLHASIGDTDRAFHWHEVARKEKSAWLFYLGVIPEFSSIRADPRYDAFVRSLRTP